MIGYTIPRGVLNIFCVQTGNYYIVSNHYAYRPDLLVESVDTTSPYKELALDALNNVSPATMQAGSIFHVPDTSYTSQFEVTS